MGVVPSASPDADRTSAPAGAVVTSNAHAPAAAAEETPPGDEAAATPASATPDRPRAPGKAGRKGDVAPSGPLVVHFMPAKPAEITLTCTGLPQKVACRAGCNVTLPSGNGTCVASANGFASKPFNYSLMQALRKKVKGPLKMKVVLVDMRR